MVPSFIFENFVNITLYLIDFAMNLLYNMSVKGNARLLI